MFTKYHINKAVEKLSSKSQNTELSYKQFINKTPKCQINKIFLRNRIWKCAVHVRS